MSTRFSIVTPSFNSEKFVAETIESVISQAGNFSIEYFIMDGGSTDETCEIVQRYQRLLAEEAYPIQCNSVVIHWVSEKDSGMYDAINKGFRNASGDIYAYINSDDIYLPGAFNTIAAVFTQYPEAEWLKGITSYINCNSTIYSAGLCHIYAREWIAKGVYGRERYFIQQDSVFWRKSLWGKVGEINPSLKLAGDYYLWVAFSKYASLISVKAYLSCFRTVEAQLSSNFSSYKKEIDEICPPNKKMGKLIRFFFDYQKILPVRIRPFFYHMAFGKHQYRMIVITSKGDMQFYEGDYYSVSSNAQ